MRNTLKMLKKVASAILALTMVLSLFGGISVSAAVSTTDSFVEDFEAGISWTAVSRLNNGTGTVTAEKLDDAHGLSAKVVPDSGKIYGAIENLNVSYTTTDLLKLTFEVYSEDTTTSNELIDIWVGNTRSTPGTPVFGIQVGKSDGVKTVKYLRNSWEATATTYTMDSGKWYQFDMVCDPSTSKVDYYMNGVKIASATTEITNGLQTVGISYRGTGCYFDNISLTKVSATDRNIFTTKGNAVVEETFEDFTPASAGSTLPTGWTGDSVAKLNFAADDDIAGTHGMKMVWNADGAALNNISKSVDIDVTEVEKIEFSFKIKIWGTSANGQTQYYAVATLNDGTNDVMGFSDIKNGGSSDKVEVKAASSDSYSTLNTDLAQSPYNFKFDDWNDMKLVWNTGGTSVEYFVNGVSIGISNHKSITNDKITKVKLGLRSQTTGEYVSFDDVKVITYTDGISTLKFADSNLNEYTFRSDNKIAGNLKNIFVPSYIASPTAADIKLFKGTTAVDYTGSYADGLYRLYLGDNLLAANNTYTIEVSGAVAGTGCGYVESFDVGVHVSYGVKELFIVTATDTASNMAAFPEETTDVMAQVKVTNTRNNPEEGILVLAVYDEYNVLKNVITEKVVAPVTTTLDPTTLTTVQTLSVDPSAHSKIRAFFWSDLDSIAPISDSNGVIGVTELLAAE